MGSAWKILPVTARSLCLSMVTNRVGQGQGRATRAVAAGARRGAGGPASKQTKIHLKKKLFSL